MRLSDLLVDKRNSTETERDIFAHFGVEPPANMPQACRVVIWNMATKLGLAMPSNTPKPNPVGAPNKWNNSIRAYVLWARIELEIFTSPPRTKKSAIYENVKEKYKYQESSKTLGNLYLQAYKDSFICLILDMVKYKTMGKHNKIEFLNRIATGDLLK